MLFEPMHFFFSSEWRVIFEKIEWTKPLWRINDLVSIKISVSQKQRHLFVEWNGIPSEKSHKNSEIKIFCTRLEFSGEVDSFCYFVYLKGDILKIKFIDTTIHNELNKIVQLFYQNSNCGWSASDFSDSHFQKQNHMIILTYDLDGKSVLHMYAFIKINKQKEIAEKRCGETLVKC